MQTLLVVAAMGGIFGHGGILSGAGLFGGGCANGQCGVGPSASMATYVQAAPIATYAPPTVQYVQSAPTVRYVQSAPTVQASSCYSTAASSCYSSQYRPEPAPPADEAANYEFSGRRSVSNPVVRQPTSTITPKPVRTKFASIRQDATVAERIPYAEPGPAINHGYDVIVKIETAEPTFEFYHDQRR